jgi:hypothetical protein
MEKKNTFYGSNVKKSILLEPIIKIYIENPCSRSIEQHHTNFQDSDDYSPHNLINFDTIYPNFFVRF